MNIGDIQPTLELGDDPNPHANLWRAAFVAEYGRGVLRSQARRMAAAVAVADFALSEWREREAMRELEAADALDADDGDDEWAP
ncbi:hypothetical protein F4X33_10525 [Candidatus Poribacteria bacterium]|nr:hypothetical protein [Candidatus Poribacteria bacterium]